MEVVVHYLSVPQVSIYLYFILPFHRNTLNLFQGGLALTLCGPRSCPVGSECVGGGCCPLPRCPSGLQATQRCQMGIGCARGHVSLERNEDFFIKCIYVIISAMRKRGVLCYAHVFNRNNRRFRLRYGQQLSDGIRL